MEVCLRTWLSLALLLPTLALSTPALAAPTEAEWAQLEGKRSTVTFVDGTTVVGTIVDVTAEQARIRADDGSITFIPKGVVSTIEETPRSGAQPVAGAAPPPPEQPPPTTTTRQGTGPRVSLGVGMGVGGGMGGASVGVGTTVGGGQAAAGGPTGSARFGQGREWVIVGVRYPLRGRETIDWMLFDDGGNPRPLSEDLMRPRALREYTFIDQWGRSVPWQAAWAAMGAEEDYVVQVKKMDNVLIPLRATETAMWVSGLGLLVYTVVDGMNTGNLDYNKPTWYIGSGLILGNVVFNLAVTTPTRNKLKIDLGRKGVERAQGYFANQP